MNYNDERAEIGFASDFIEGMLSQWIGPSSNRCLGEFKIERRREHICDKAG